MKRIITILSVLILCLALTVSVFASPGAARLYDGADILTASEESYLSAKLDEVSEAYKVDIVIAVLDTVGEYSSDEYIEYYFDNYGYGYGENRDGVLLMLAMAERDYRILSNGFAADAITNDDIDYIGDLIAPYLSDGDYAYAFELFIDECEYEIDGEINGFPFPFGTSLLISVVIGFIVALIATGSMKAQLKSVRMQTGASEYSKAGSMNITNSNDIFLYRTVNRRKKETSSSSGSRSGSSRNVGGGKF